jgi:hypothetical protein
MITDHRLLTSSSGKPGGGEMHLSITALKINGLPGINDTINIGGTNLTFTHGILTATDEQKLAESGNRGWSEKGGTCAITAGEAVPWIVWFGFSLFLSAYVPHFVVDPSVKIGSPRL